MHIVYFDDNGAISWPVLQMSHLSNQCAQKRGWFTIPRSLASTFNLKRLNFLISSYFYQSFLDLLKPFDQ